MRPPELRQNRIGLRIEIIHDFMLILNKINIYNFGKNQKEFPQGILPEVFFQFKIYNDGAHGSHRHSFFTEATALPI